MLSAIAADHVQRQRRRGALAGATHVGVSGIPGDGPFVKIWLVVDAGVVREASYETHGCPSSVACASMLCELAIGRELARIQSLTAPELVRILGGLPEGKAGFAELAVGAIADVALADGTTSDGTREACGV